MDASDGFRRRRKSFAKWISKQGSSGWTGTRIFSRAMKITLSLREVRRKREKVRWTFFPPNGRRRFFCAPAGTKGEGDHPSSPSDRNRDSYLLPLSLLER